MGARPKRSTLSALELIDETVRTAWKGKRKNGNIVSILSFNISSTYQTLYISGSFIFSNKRAS